MQQHGQHHCRIIFWSNLEIEDMAYTYIEVLLDIICFLFRNSSNNRKGDLKVENKNNKKAYLLPSLIIIISLLQYYSINKD